MTNQRQPTDDPPGAAPDRSEPEHVLAAQARAYREKLGMTQAEVARAMAARGFPGMQQSTIAKVEAAQRPVRVNEAAALAAVLHAELADLITDPARQGKRDALTVARDEERELAGQILQAERNLDIRRTEWIHAEAMMAEAMGDLQALQERHAEARQKAEALAAAGTEGSESDLAH